MKAPSAILLLLIATTTGAYSYDSDRRADGSIPSGTTPHHWKGWYVGANAGYTWGASDVSYVQDGFSVYGFDFAKGDSGFELDRKLHPKSGIGGVQGGYDYQTRQLILGVVADFDYRPSNAKTTIGPLFAVLNDFLSISTEQKWLGTLRLRIGVEPCKACLIYTTGGLAYGRVQHAHVQTIDVLFDRSFDSHRAFSESQTKVGWAVGGGMEYRFDRNWSVGAEYLYVDLGSDTVRTSVGAGNDLSGYELLYPATSVLYDETFSVARVILNYRFGGP